MKTKIDCLVIGPNDIGFERKWELIQSRVRPDSVLYRNMYTEFIDWDNRKYTCTDIVNKLSPKTIGDNSALDGAVSHIVSYLNKNDVSCLFINSYQSEKNKLKSYFEKYEILSIAITTTLYLNPFPLFEVVNFIKSNNVNSKIIIGGAFIKQLLNTKESDETESTIKSLSADIFVESYLGEDILVNVICHLKTNRSLDKIPNIIFKENGVYRYNRCMEGDDKSLINCCVDWNLFDNWDFYYLRTSHSCPFRCNFCTYPQTGSYETKNIDRIKSELFSLNAKKGMKGFTFIDDTLNFPVTRFQEILRNIIKSNYHFQWLSFIRCQYLDEETVELMRKSGCRAAFLGIESGDEKILRQMNKRASIDEYLKGIALLKKYEIVTCGSFIVGFPLEDACSVENTIDFIENSGIDFYTPNLWIYELNSPISAMAETLKLAGSGFNWSHLKMDSAEATNHIYKMIKRIKNSIRCPHDFFGFDNIFQLLCYDVSLNQIKNILILFNQAIKEKISNPLQYEVSAELANKFFRDVKRNSDPSLLNVNFNF